MKKLFKKNVHAKNLAKIHSLYETNQKFYQIEKVSFYKKWHETPHRCRKMEVWGGKFITR